MPGEGSSLDRRGFVAGALLGGLGLAVPCAVAQGRDPALARLDDPAFNVRALARLAATLAPGETGYVHYRGRAFGVDGVGPNRLLFGIEGLAALAARPQDDGSIRFLFNEAAVYTDPSSGRPLEHWTNPYTGERLAVWHQRNGPVNFAVSPGPSAGIGKFDSVDDTGGRGFRLPWRVDGDVATYAQDVTSERPNPIDPAVWPDYSTGPVLYIAEHSQYRVSLGELLNEAIPSLEFFAALQSLKPWHPWMRMGDRPGRVFTRMTSMRADGVQSLSHDVRAFAEKELAAYLSAPGGWTGEYRDAYTIFRSTLGASADQDNQG